MHAMRALLAVPLLRLALASATQAAGDPRSAELLAAQAKAMAPLSNFDGTWRRPGGVAVPPQ